MKTSIVSNSWKRIVFLISIIFVAGILTRPLYSQESFEEKELLIRLARQAIAQKASINRQIKVDEAAGNYNLIGKAVEWNGQTCFADQKNGVLRMFVNSNNVEVRHEKNMDSVFGIIFPVELPKDPRISDTSSDIRVKGKIVGFEKVFNPKISIISSQRQPIIEAVEIEFSRRPYVESLHLKFF